MNKRLLVTLCLVLLQFIAYFPYAQAEDSPTGDGGQAGAFLRYGVGVRALGMGRAYVALADDAASIYYNPAGLMQLEKMEFHVMGVNLYDQSCYSYFAIGLPRPDWGKNRLTNFFLGPNASWGVSWINLNSGDFDRRDAQDKWQGTSSVNQNAWHLGFAREEVLFGSWAILDWGTSLKVIRQEVFKSGGWSYGADLGVQLRFINPLGSKRFPSLRTILPLRIGLSLQNAIIPKVNLDGAAEKYPPSLKAGWSYAWTVSERFKLIAANDYDWLFRPRGRWAFWKYGSYPERGTGIYGGLEGQYSWPGIIGFVRAGMNNRQDDFTIGCGLKKKIFGLDLGFDYCYVFHDLGEIDNYRISLTLRTSAPRDAGHFRRRGLGASKTEALNPEDTRATHTDSTLAYPLPTATTFERDIRLQALARYSYEGRSDTVLVVAEELARDFDKSNKGRYWDFIGGTGKASWLFSRAKEAFKNPDIGEARNDARPLANESRELYKGKDGSSASDDRDSMNLAEDYLMLGNYDSAGSCLANLDGTQGNSLRLNYLKGVCFKNQLGLTSKAIDAFTTAIAAGNRKDSASMLNLSVLGLADCLYNEGQNDAAIAILLPLIEGCNMPLDSDYPRYPIFADGNIADDALYIMGQCCEAKGDKPTAKAIYAMIARFIPNSRYYITEEIKKAIERLNK